MLQILLFLILLLAIFIIFFMILVSLIRYYAQQRKGTVNQKLKRSFIRNSKYLVGIIVITVMATFFSQFSASTPPITDEHGQVIPTSVADLVEVELNGRKQWISIRGNDKNLPILLFLAGGPGGTQMAAVRHDLADLEKHFIVVNWDQPGSGKSYDLGKNLTPEIYIEDGISLSEYLIDRFQQEKIYLVGESWGSALGVFMATEKPELFHAFIGTGQMVDFLETELMDYDKAMEIAKEKNDTNKIDALLEMGKPPYYEDVTWKSAEYLNYLSSYMNSNPEITNRGYQTFRDIFASEYGIIDKVNFLRGIVTTFNHVYPQLYDIDLKEDYASLRIPVYFFLGRHDINAPTELVEEYYDVLDAPSKEIIWFETSGHSPWINESPKFINELVNIKNK